MAAMRRRIPWLAGVSLSRAKLLAGGCHSRLHDPGITAPFEGAGAFPLGRVGAAGRIVPVQPVEHARVEGFAGGPVPGRW